MTTILFVDDDSSLCSLVKVGLERRGISVRTASDVGAALTVLEHEDVDVLVTDLAMPGVDGVGLCAVARDRFPDLPVVVLTGHGTVSAAVDALRAGAKNFLLKPVELDALAHVVVREAEEHELRNEVKRLRLVADRPAEVDDLLGHSSAVRTLRSVIARVAPSGATVLIAGDSGVGKELVARALHRSSPRGSGPFVALNCAAVPADLLESELFGHEKGAFTDAQRARDGLFVQANGGTLFLDEIGEMPLSLQPKLLRALQERRVRPLGGQKEVAVDVRVIAATNRDLHEEVRAGRFREDLLYRLDVVRIEVPPLRHRREDVPILAEHFLGRVGGRGKKRVEGFTPRALELLVSYDWPGNVRELENCVERACALVRGAVVDVDDLPDNVVSFKPSDIVITDGAPETFVVWDELERRYILKVIDVCKGNKSEAARILGIDRRTLYRKLERWGEASAEEERRALA